MSPTPLTPEQIRETYINRTLTRFPEAFRERVIDACNMFHLGYTPKNVRDIHGYIVMDEAIRIEARCNGWRQVHRSREKDEIEYKLSFPIFNHPPSSTLESAMRTGGGGTRQAYLREGAS